jgi:hypothetical protein
MRVISRVADPDPGSGAFLFDPWILDLGWIKKQDPDHISENLETFFWLGILKYLNGIASRFDAKCMLLKTNRIGFKSTVLYLQRIIVFRAQNDVLENNCFMFLKGPGSN